MLAVALLAPLVSASAVCDLHNNDPETGLNYEDCNNAGKCVQRPSGQYCDCCDVTDETNWCYGTDLIPGTKFTGSSCTTAEFVHAVGFGWRFETTEGEVPAMTCSDMDSTPPTEGGIGHSTTPSLQHQVNVAMHVGGYRGITFAAACKTCREDSKCDFSDEGAHAKGMTAGFATELNTYYSKSCLSFKIHEPADCPANYDMGFSAYQALLGAFGADAALATGRLNSILDGTAAACAMDEVNCLDWTETKATVFAKKDYAFSKTYISTRPPTVEPTDMPTAEPEAPVLGAGAPCPNGQFAACGGANHSGATCCPAGMSCLAVLPFGALSLCSPNCFAGWACNM